MIHASVYDGYYNGITTPVVFSFAFRFVRLLVFLLRCSVLFFRPSDVLRSVSDNKMTAAAVIAAASAACLAHPPLVPFYTGATRTLPVPGGGAV